MRLVWSKDLEELVRRAAGHWCRLLGIAGADAEDVGQDAVVKAWRMVESGSLGCEHGVWALARRSALNMLEENERRERLACEVVEAVVCESVVSRVLLEEVARKYPELVAVSEARAEGMEWDVIGEAFGISAAAAKMRWHRLAIQAAEEFEEMVPGLLRTIEKSGLT